MTNFYHYVISISTWFLCPACAIPLAMIPRYSRPQMTALFAPEQKFKNWLAIERAAAESMEAQGTIPSGVAAAFDNIKEIDAEKIDAIEAVVKHDVIAFLTHVGEQIGPMSRYVHQGLTSSDILDTSLAMTLRDAADLLLEGVGKVKAALKTRAIEHKETICIGRSHGIHAEPTSFGLKLAGHYAAFDRAEKRLKAAKEDIAVCALSGAVGTYSTVTVETQAYVAAKLGLTEETVSTQVIPRDRHAHYFAVCGIIASSIENLAVEIRHLQRSEVREAEEYFDEGQKGSSAMPHKRNPVLSENLTGLARVVRAAVIPALENVALWHERDISHSAVERTLLPDALIALDFALHRLAGIVERLLVYPERMEKNLWATGGLWASQRCMLALTQKDISREDAYKAVQTSAMNVWHNLGQTDLPAELAKNSVVSSALTPDEIKELFNLNHYKVAIATAFKRVF